MKLSCHSGWSDLSIAKPVRPSLLTGRQRSPWTNCWRPIMGSRRATSHGNGSLPQWLQVTCGPGPLNHSTNLRSRDLFGFLAGGANLGLFLPHQLAPISSVLSKWIKRISGSNSRLALGHFLQNSTSVRSAAPCSVGYLVIPELCGFHSWKYPSGSYPPQ